MTEPTRATQQPPRRQRPLPARIEPQTRPTPTLREARAQIAFLRARLHPPDPAATSAAHPAAAHGPASHAVSQAALAAAILAPGGLLERYQRAAWYASHPPHGLEQAWCLVAATLATVVADLTAPWTEHPAPPTPPRR
ncbi:hypothetical protein [Actinomadura sp. 21ATH]|uniref:hypothetical protein n=1 Tax=Actinomadura sp. 21ATH TaxID=1735444 RepID=UPI0035BF5602